MEHRPRIEPRRRRFFTGALVAAVFVLGGWSAHAQVVTGSIRAGMLLSEALTALKEYGVEVVFTSALVHDHMTVRAEPSSTDPQIVLRELLEPYGLTISSGEAGRMVVVRQTAQQPNPTGAISGSVLLDSGDQALPFKGASVEVLGIGSRTVTNDRGAFAFRGLPPGVYALEVRSAGRPPKRLTGVEVVKNEVVRVELELQPAHLFLNEIIVTPGHYRILDDELELRQFLSHDEVVLIPHVADDLYRAVQWLPGASGGDISARFSIRGGAADETLVRLDGMELLEPFHFKDFQNLFSIVDSEAVGGVDVLTGVFPAQYGDRMAGVMDIESLTPGEGTHTSLSLGTMSSRVLSLGRFNDDRGSWLVSGRIWYPDALLKAVGGTDDSLLTDYYDMLAKIEHPVGERSTLSANILFADDDLGFRTEDFETVEQVSAQYRSAQMWGNLTTAWSPSLDSRTVLGAGFLNRRRVGGQVDIEEGTLDVNDRREFHALDFRQDWRLTAGENHLFSWGFDVQWQTTDVSYTRSEADIDSNEQDDVVIDLDESGQSVGLYVSDRFRLSSVVAAEVGLRWDRQSWDADDQLSPRLNLMISPSATTTIRFGWGLFRQSQRLNETMVEDGDPTLYPAQRAEQLSAGIEHFFRSGLSFRFDLYSKDYSDLRPRYENLFSPFELFPEAMDDRVRLEPETGRARGAELVVKKVSSDRWSWWFSYALTEAEDVIDGTSVPRSWDQPHAAAFGVNLRMPRAWNINLGGSFHSGWPTTAVSGEVVDWVDGEPVVEYIYGPRNQIRYPSYYRFDLRVTKAWPAARGELLLFIDIMNVTYKKNVCCQEGFLSTVLPDGTVEVAPEPGFWAPIVPSIGVTWSF